MQQHIKLCIFLPQQKNQDSFTWFLSVCDFQLFCFLFSFFEEKLVFEKTLHFHFSHFILQFLQHHVFLHFLRFREVERTVMVLSSKSFPYILCLQSLIGNWSLSPSDEKGNQSVIWRKLRLFIFSLYFVSPLKTIFMKIFFFLRFFLSPSACMRKNHDDTSSLLENTNLLT